MIRILRGAIRDFPLRNNYHREGWWWHSSGSPDGYEFGYSPEGPFITKEHARRHLLNTMRAGRKAEMTGQWHRTPTNAGWCPGWGSRSSRPTMKPLPHTRFFGRKLRDYIKENEG